jgi:hypothetical protein
VPLAQHYPGDDAWRSFVEVAAEAWPTCTFKQELLLVVHGDVLLAQAMYGVLGSHALSWISSSVPALEGHAPRSLLSSDAGILSVRTCLMRMP